MSKFAAIVMALLSVFTLPIMILNCLGGIVGGIWLAFLGEWSLIGGGLLIIFLGHFAISILLAPAAILAAPSMWAFNKGYMTIGSLLAVPTILWTYVLLAVWCATCLMTCIFYMHGTHLVPALLWGYTLATSSWTYLAQFEARSDRNAPAIVTSFAAQVGCIIVMIDVLISDVLPSRNEIFLALGIPLFCAFAFQALVMIATLAQERKYRTE